MKFFHRCMISSLAIRFALIITLVGYGNLPAQEFCGTPDVIAGPQKSYGGDNECNVSPMVTYVKIIFTIYRKNFGGYTQQDLPGILEIVNENFADSKIQFYYEECETADWNLNNGLHPNHDFIDWKWDQNVYLNPANMEAAMSSTLPPADGIHVHLWKDLSDAGPGQIRIFGNAFSIPSSKIWIQGHTGGYRAAEHEKVLTHELGHALGLFHTFQGSCEPGNILCIPSNDMAAVEVNDFVEDTDLDPKAVNGNGVDECQWTGGGTCYFDGPEWNPDIDNYMNYTWGCTQKFTECQSARMKEILQQSNVEVPVSCDCFSSENIIVNSTIEWENSMGTSGDVIINSGGKLKISSIAFFSESTEITVKAGGELILDFAVLMPCTEADKWKGIYLEDGAIFRANNSKIKGAEIGLDVTTKKVYTNLLTINECTIGINIENTGEVTANPGGGAKLVFTNVTTDSPVNVENSLVQFKGCHFDTNGNIVATNASLFLYPSEIEPFRRCDFDDTKVTYVSGPRFQIDESNFQNTSGASVTINKCAWFTACRSRFIGDAIFSDDVDRYDVFLNMFLGADEPSLLLNSGYHFNSSIRDNYFSENIIDLKTTKNSSGEELFIYCNRHNDYDKAWVIEGPMQDQGDDENSALNGFRSSFSTLDIVCEENHKFDYYYLQGEAAPFNRQNVGLNLATIHLSEGCSDELDDIITIWGEYVRCYSNAPPNLKSYIVCCNCCSPPPPPTENPVWVPGEGEEPEIDVRESSKSIYLSPNPVSDNLNIHNLPDNYHLKVYDLNGRLVLSMEGKTHSASLDLSNLQSGLYNILIESNKTLIHEDIFIKS